MADFFPAPLAAQYDNLKSLVVLSLYRIIQELTSLLALLNWTRGYEPVAHPLRRLLFVHTLTQLPEGR